MAPAHDPSSNLLTRQPAVRGGRAPMGTPSPCWSHCDGLIWPHLVARSVALSWRRHGERSGSGGVGVRGDSDSPFCRAGEWVRLHRRLIKRIRAHKAPTTAAPTTPPAMRALPSRSVDEVPEAVAADSSPSSDRAAVVDGATGLVVATEGVVVVVASLEESARPSRMSVTC